MEYTFENLTNDITNAHTLTSKAATGAVNQLLTIRNWIIGYYIVEFEQSGEERAKYGTHLLKKLEESLDFKGSNTALFYKCRLFYQRYPQIFSTASKKLKALSKLNKSDDQSILTHNLYEIIENKNEKFSTASKKFETDPEVLINKLSFSHIMEIAPIDDPFQRFFYEFECIKGVWSVQELRRQIGSNLYFRSGISKNPELLLTKIKKSDETTTLSLNDPVSLEFLGLDGKIAVTESDLEQALMDHLQDFLLEMGKGFCFEARQKRIIIDDEYYYIDLVLYNRILHCNVIIELKDAPFSHENMGQLNAYVAYYKENEMNMGDNPPIGILLCTKKGNKMVEYALSGLDNPLFVSTYMLQLPDKEQLQEFIIKQMEMLDQSNE
ncbi:MAG: DUF1016 family protein [Oscillospiraceae bacterium]|nr:DUF1016 family protein [Oscillospiraceae bacterium]MBP1591889.1 DUF1016 family protein [Oscillospiraceae bacterium]